ncbi:hypothetical protein SGPA1_20465 [Streptomyces misionensis JCM 4497]
MACQAYRYCASKMPERWVTSASRCDKPGACG